MSLKLKSVIFFLKLTVEPYQCTELTSVNHLKLPANGMEMDLQLEILGHLFF